MTMLGAAVVVVLVASILYGIVRFVIECVTVLQVMHEERTHDDL